MPSTATVMVCVSLSTVMETLACAAPAAKNTRPAKAMRKERILLLASGLRCGAAPIVPLGFICPKSSAGSSGPSVASLMQGRAQTWQRQGLIWRRHHFSLRSAAVEPSAFGFVAVAQPFGRIGVRCPRAAGPVSGQARGIYQDEQDEQHEHDEDDRSDAD